MIFCLGEDSSESKGAGYHKSYSIFNSEVTREEWEKVKKSLPTIELPVNVWVDKKEMTDDEKENSSGWEQTGGFLRTLDYQGAWKLWWSTAAQKDKDAILNCKYFKADIFTGITGIKDFKSTSLKGKKVSVEIDGVKYGATID